MWYEALQRNNFEPFFIDHLVDERGRFEYSFQKDFPLLIKFFSFVALSNAFRLNWHERLELFIPLTGQGLFRMGSNLFEFSAGDIIIVDNMKLHGLLQFEGERRQAVVVTFLPHFIYNLNSCLCDFVLVSPFYSVKEGVVPVLRSSDTQSIPAHRALAKLVTCYAKSNNDLENQAGCKAYLLELLFHIADRFRESKVARSEYLIQQERSQRLGKLFDLIQQEYSEQITVGRAASVVGMSESQFMKFFKRATGMTFIDYLTRIRLHKAHQVLTESTLSVAEVAYSVGFSDQSYFTKRFREVFGMPPRELRNSGTVTTVPSPEH